MRRNKHWLFIIVALTVILTVAACGPKPAPEPEVIKATPTEVVARPAPSEVVIATPTPAISPGPLPSILAEVDLGVPAGNGHNPVALTLDEETGLAYVLSEQGEQEGQGIISVLDLDQGQVVRTIRLDRPGRGGLFFVEGRLFWVEADQPALALDPQTGESVSTLPNASTAAPDGKGNLVMANAEGLMVVEAASGELIREIPLVFVGALEALAADGEIERIYVATQGELLILDAQGRLVASYDLEGEWGHHIALDRYNQLLYVVDAGQIKAFDGQTGATLDFPVVSLGPEDITPAVQSLVVDGEAGRLYVADAFHADWYGTAQVEVVDLGSGQVIGHIAGPMGYGVGQLALDRPRNQLVATTRATDTVRVYGAHPLELARTISLGTTLIDAVLDPEAERLYVSDNAGWIHVFDTESDTELTSIAGGQNLALDVARHRLYAGDYQTEILALDTGTLEAIGRVPQPGKPVVNPASGEVYIVNYSVYVADAEQLTVTGDLYPELGKPYPDCPVCYYTIVTDLVVDPAGQEMYPITYTPWPGKPSDYVQVAVDAHTGRVYHMILKGGYYRYGIVSVHQDMASFNAQEPPEAWLDGLAGEIAVDGLAKRLYLAWGSRLFVLDADRLAVIGRLDSRYLPIAAVDSRGGRLYALDGDQLVVLATSGGWPATYPPETVEALSDEVRAIYPSPAYAADRTIFVVTENIHRSEDDGDSWVQLAGDMVERYSLSINLSFSPDFATDETLFAFRGTYGQSLGEGVYRSTDRGDTWQPVWNGLNHLRVHDVALSPDYAADGTLLAYATYQEPTTLGNAYSIFRSTDRGLSWTLEMTRSQSTDLPSPYDLLPPDAHLVRFRANCTYDSDGQKVCYVERTADGGRTWEEILAIHEPSLHRALPSPNFDDDGTIYGLSDYDLFRSTDGGNTWERWLDERLAGRDFEQRLTVMAVAPLPDEGRNQLFVGTGAGELWSLDPTMLIWEPFVAATPTSIPSPTRTPVPTLPPSPVETPMTMPPEGLYRPEGVFQELWAADAELQQALGWALDSQASTVATALQPFEGGAMIWREDRRLIYALHGDGSWGVFDDTWTPGELEQDPSIVPPEGLLQPIRGFGKVWRNNPEVRAGLGWALQEETGHTSPVQAFERGVLIRTADTTYALILAAGRPATWYQR